MGDQKFLVNKILTTLSLGISQIMGYKWNCWEIAAKLSHVNGTILRRPKSSVRSYKWDERRPSTEILVFKMGKEVTWKAWGTPSHFIVFICFLFIIHYSHLCKHLIFQKVTILICHGYCKSPAEIKLMHLFLGSKYLQMFSDGNINAPQLRWYLNTLENNCVSAICSC